MRVAKIDRKQRKRTPGPPFTTSTLQQDANRKLGFTAQRTMRTAQQLYEGAEIGGESVGLITYMRTDSVNSWRRTRSPKSAKMIGKRYGANSAAAGATVLQGEIEERAGSARGDPPDLVGTRA